MKVSKSKIEKVKGYLFITFFLISIALFLVGGLIGYSEENLAWVLSNSHFAKIIYVIWIAIATATTLPVTAIFIPGIIIFSFKEALFYGFFGFIIGGSTVFILTKYLGKSFVKNYSNLSKGRAKMLDEMIQKNYFELMILLNCVYFFPSNMAYMVGGLSETSYKKFFFALILGNFSNYFSTGLLTIGIMTENITYILVAVILIILVTAIPLFIYRRHLKKIAVLVYSEEGYKELLRVEKMVKKLKK